MPQIWAIACESKNKLLKEEWMMPTGDQILARRIVDAAMRNKDTIDPIISRASLSCSGQLVGLEYCLKSIESILSKFSRSTSGRKTVNDALRYTVLLPRMEYVQKFESFITFVEGYGIYEKRRRNGWAVEDAARGGYRGINSVFEMQDHNPRAVSNKFQFEVQFHTWDSFQAVKNMHGIYDDIRELDRYDDERARGEVRAVHTFAFVKCPPEANLLPSIDWRGRYVHPFDWFEFDRRWKMA
ncbi:hypothetical protein ONV78_20595 [Hahella sp. CR1]|uniref:hypothetical protein n=1 Tax=Hahella sp. CR1 TaxID=2992807 RepID=UPI00244205D5|nr:hypothetical protein [Hahella sp. CR1]MDG9670148.1 hypothetical protein [Hahella sp. CR1]